MTQRRRIWITGIGVITAIGTGKEAFRAGLRAGRSPVTRIDRFDPSEFRSQVAAQVDDFDPLAWMPPKTTVLNRLNTSQRKRMRLSETTRHALLTLVSIVK